MKKMLILTAVLLGSSVALAQSLDPSGFDLKALGSNPFVLASTVLLGTAFVKERFPQLKGAAVLGVSFGLSLVGSAALFYTGNGATVGTLTGAASWLVYGGLGGLIASGFKDLASSLLGVLGGKKPAQVITAPGTPGTAPSSASIVPVGGVQDAPK